MNTQQLKQVPMNVRRPIGRRWWWLSLIPLLVAALVIYEASHGAPVLTSTGSTSAGQLDPAAQSVMDYLHVHSSIPAHALPQDPAAQSVMDYLRVHSSIPAHALPVDPAVQSVLDYLRAHGE